MAVPNINGFRVKKGNETGIAKIATEAYLDKSVTKAKLAQAVQDTLDDVGNKADQDGEYDSLTAGGAKQLLSTAYVDDNEPYNFRTAGGSADIGDRVTEKVVGGTIVWNQISDNSRSTTTTNGITFTNNGDGSITANGTSTDQATFNSVEHSEITAQVGHVYLLMGCPTHDIINVSYYIQDPFQSAVDRGTGRVYKRTSTSSRILTQIYIGVGVTLENAVFKPQLFDLTQMFGSTIADYIYSLEQGTEGAGVAWFRKLFPKPYYEYNAGELMSVKAGSHNTVGFNAWDEEWEIGIINASAGNNEPNSTTIRSKNYIPVLAGATYYCEKLGGSDGIRELFWYDSEKRYLYNTINTGLAVNKHFTVRSDVRYVRFRTYEAYGTTYKKDICIHLAWDGERDGEYEPYEKHTYPLAELELRGIPKLDANNQLYYDGDTYASDGTVTRKYGIVDLGTMSYQMATIGGVNRFTNTTLASRAAALPLLLCTKYPVDYTVSSSDVARDKFITRSGSDSSKRIWFWDNSYTDADAFKTAMSGVYLVYELATPTTETADTFVNPQVVDDFGTEEYTDYAVEAGDRDVAIPVGHNSQYMNNLRAKLEMAPDSPSGDGKYIVQQSNGENAYVPYTADGRLDAIEAKLPAPPSANGTYKLTATVTDGGVTYTWVAG